MDLQAKHGVEGFEHKYVVHPSTQQRIVVVPVESSTSASAESLSPFEASYHFCQTRRWSRVQEGLHNFFGRTILQEAIVRDDLEVVQELTQRKMALVLRDTAGNQPLFYSAQTESAQAVEGLCTSNSVTNQNISGQTPLHSASEYGNVAAIHILLAKGALPNTRATLTWEGVDYPHEITAFHLAIMKGQANSIRALFPVADLSLVVRPIGNFLHMAIAFHQPFILREFLLDPDYQKVARGLINSAYNGVTPAMLAAKMGRLECLAMLQEFGADLTAADTQGRTAVHYAAIGKQKECIGLLHYYGCVINTIDAQRKTPADLSNDAEIEGFITNLMQQQQAQQHHKIIPFELPENIFYKGGGPKGLAYQGVGEVLEEEGMLQNLKRVGGTSAGGINAAFLALGFTSKDTKEWLSTDFSTFLDHPFTADRMKGWLQSHSVMDLYRGAQKVAQFFASPLETLKDELKDLFLNKLWHAKGVCKGDKLLEWIGERVEKATGDCNFTFGELAKAIQEKRPGKNFKHLYVYTSDVRTKTPVCINSEDLYWKDVCIKDAVLCSALIPGVFEYRVLHKKDDQGKRVPAPEFGTHVDGGLIRNFGFEVFDQWKFHATNPSGQAGNYHFINQRTWGISLFTPNEKPIDPSKPIESILDLLKGVVGIYNHAESLLQAQVYDNYLRVIKVSNEGVGLLDFSLTQTKKDLLVASGRRYAQEFIQKRRSPYLISNGFQLPNTVPPLPRDRFRPFVNFVGREGELFALQKKTGTSVAALVGPSTIGKTEIARKFAYDHFDEFGSIVWFDASSASTLHHSYQEAARTLGIPFRQTESLEITRARVHRHLRTWSQEKPCLAIFDNVNREIPLPEDSEKCRIIVTSQEEKLWSPALRIPVEPLSEKESIKLVCSITELPESLEMVDLVYPLKGIPANIVRVAREFHTNPGMTVASCIGRLSDFGFATTYVPPVVSGREQVQAMLDLWSSDTTSIEPSLTPNPFWANAKLQKVVLSDVQQKIREFLFLVRSARARELITANQSNGFSLYHNAAGLGQLDVVQFLDSYINEDRVRSEAFFGAVCRQKHGVVSWFLTKQIDPNIRVQGRIALCEAILNNDEKMVRLLLPHANLSLADAQGFLAIHVASAMGNETMVEAIHAKDRSQINQVGRAGITALLIAVYKDDIKITRFLLQKGANVDARMGPEKIGINALYLAILNGNREMVELLKQSGIVSVQDAHGNYPAHWVAKSGFVQIADTIIDRDNVKVRGANKRTPLHYAVYNKHYSMITFLMGLGADINACTDDGDMRKPPLHDAVVHGDLEAMKMLVRDPALDVTIRNKVGQTAFTLAVESGKVDSVRMIIRHPSWIKEGIHGSILLPGRNAVSISALHYSVRNSYYEMMDLLIENGANINTSTTVTQGSTTPLHEAVAKRDRVAVQMLAKYPQLDVMKKNGEGRTALDIAIIEGDVEIAETIASHQSWVKPEKLHSHTAAIKRNKASMLPFLSELAKGGFSDEKKEDDDIS